MFHACPAISASTAGRFDCPSATSFGARLASVTIPKGPLRTGSYGGCAIAMSHRTHRSSGIARQASGGCRNASRMTRSGLGQREALRALTPEVSTPLDDAEDVPVIVGDRASRVPWVDRDGELIEPPLPCGGSLGLTPSARRALVGIEQVPAGVDMLAGAEGSDVVGQMQVVSRMAVDGEERDVVLRVHVDGACRVDLVVA